VTATDRVVKIRVSGKQIYVNKSVDGWGGVLNGGEHTAMTDAMLRREVTDERTRLSAARYTPAEADTVLGLLVASSNFDMAS
jgi:hypothetical protein